MNREYRLEEKRASRPGWVKDISFSVQWVRIDPRLLGALAGVRPPSQTLIHLARWRTSNYDIDYPDYQASADATAFMERANAMGFKVMPHFNCFACYLKHPFCVEVLDWQIRSAGRNEPQGWYFPPGTFDYTRMGYIHPGLGLWRRTLVDAVLNACRTVKAPAAFLDQTLCTWNTDNGVVENRTTVEGMRQIHEELTAVQPDLVLAGEGLNEISFQREAFAQAHVYDSFRGQLQPHHVLATHPICAYLWSAHARLVGYRHLRPTDKDWEIGVEVYRRMGAIPTPSATIPS